MNRNRIGRISNYFPVPLLLWLSKEELKFFSKNFSQNRSAKIYRMYRNSCAFFQMLIFLIMSMKAFFSFYANQFLTIFGQACLKLNKKILRNKRQSITPEKNYGRSKINKIAAKNVTKNAFPLPSINPY